MNEHILLVEDEEELCVILADRLKADGYVVEVATDGRTGFEKATKSPFDLIILDVMLPYRNGFDLCVGLRKAGLATPIVLLTARNQTAEKIVGLKLGADDYVTKPFDMFELTARIEAILRRAPARAVEIAPAKPDKYEFDSVVIDTRKANVTRNGKHVTLTAREFYLLCYMADHRGEALSRDQLLRDVWGHQKGTFTRTVDMHMSSLRQKLEKSPQKPALLLTVPGIGYKLVE